VHDALLTVDPTGAPRREDGDTTSHAQQHTPIASTGDDELTSGQQRRSSRRGRRLSYDRHDSRPSHALGLLLVHRMLGIGQPELVALTIYLGER
jgi:hypothetical protein